MVPIAWNDMSLHLPPDTKREDNLRYTPSKAIYTFTNGAIVPPAIRGTSMRSQNPSMTAA